MNTPWTPDEFEARLRGARGGPRTRGLVVVQALAAGRALRRRCGLEIARTWCDSRERQERALQIVQFKLDILWAMLDAIERAYPDDLPEAVRP